MLSWKMLSLIVVIVFAIVFAFPAFAQEATPEPTVTPPVVIVSPSPIDTAQLPTWGFLVIIVLALGVVSVASVGILQAAKGLPEWSKPILISGLNSGVDQLDTYAKITPSTLDDAVVAELRQRIQVLEKQMLTAIPTSELNKPALQPPV